MSLIEKQIIVYGTNWCPDCTRSKRFLEERSIAYQWINIDEVPGAADLVRRINNGMQSVPTIVFPNGDVLIEPSNTELGSRLGVSP